METSTAWENLTSVLSVAEGKFCKFKLQVTAIASIQFDHFVAVLQAELTNAPRIGNSLARRVVNFWTRVLNALGHLYWYVFSKFYRFTGLYLRADGFQYI